MIDSNFLNSLSSLLEVTLVSDYFFHSSFNFCFAFFCRWLHLNFEMISHFHLCRCIQG